jgi:mono/diheme cytochrome c family protein
MPHLSELHGAATHLAIVAIPLYAVLLLLRRLGRSGPSTTAWEPWVLGAAVVGIVASGLTGLLVWGESKTELRGSHYGIGGIHFWLGIAIAAVMLGLAVAQWRRRAAAPVVLGVAGLAFVAVLAQGYLGGRMTYERGVGVESLGEATQTARGASALHVALASGTAPERAGRMAFSDAGLGCASCHGDQAQGGRGPRLAGGRDLDEFRRVHAHGLFPPAVITDRDFTAIDAYLRTLGAPEGR